MEPISPGVKEAVNQLFKIVASKAYKLLTFKQVAQLQNIDVLSIKNSQGQTLLHVAAGFGRKSFVEYLISQGADINAQDVEGLAPLHNACNHAHSNMTRLLLEAGANVNLRDSKGWTPLHWAISRRDNVDKICPDNWKVVEILLSFGADPYIESSTGKSCFKRMEDPDQRRCVRLVHLTNKLKDCDSKHSRERTIYNYIKVKDFFELVKLGDDNMDILELLTTPRLLNSRLETCDNITPLHRAAGYNHINTAKLFIALGANVNATDDHGRIPLHNAAQYGHIDMIELLTSERSDINKQDLEGNSPLHVAASNRTFTACLKLIELGANIHSRCNTGELPYDLAQSDDVKEVLKPEGLRHRVEMIPSTSDQAIYIGLQEDSAESQQDRSFDNESLSDELMLDSSQSKRLFNNTNYSIKKVTLNENDWRYQLVKRRLVNTIVTHISDLGGKFSKYEITTIELILHEKVWSKYRLMCQRLEIDYGAGSKNEKLLFHGSNFIDKIQGSGFDERYAQRNGMFGAGIYFAAHSSKSNQYAFGWGLGCSKHGDKSCYLCERKMIYAQVALGRSLISKEAMPDCAHAPPGYSSVTGLPEATDGLTYPEYVIYSGDQAYPLFVITYKIKP